MDLRGRLKRLPQAFVYAGQGIKESFQAEFNLKIHIFVATLVIIAGFVFNVTSIEWAVLLLCIALVISLELINSSIERVVDLVSGGDYHPLARVAKDSAAGAVLVSSIIAAIIGLIIFIPYLFQFIKGVL